MMSSYTARTSALASAYSISLTVVIGVSSARSAAHGMAHPHIGLDVEAALPRPVDPDGIERAGHDEGPAHREVEPGPLLPLCERRLDNHGPLRDAHHARAQPPVHAQPGIEGTAARRAPAHVPFHRHERIASLERRAHWGDQGAEAVAGGDPAHLLDHARAEPVAARAEIHHRGERGHGAGRAPPLTVRETARDHVRDAMGEIGGGAAPVEGYGVAHRDHAPALVPEPELEVGEVGAARD